MTFFVELKGSFIKVGEVAFLFLLLLTPRKAKISGYSVGARLLASPDAHLTASRFTSSVWLSNSLKRC